MPLVLPYRSILYTYNYKLTLQEVCLSLSPHLPLTCTMSASPGTVSPRQLQTTFPALDNTLGAMLIGTAMSSMYKSSFPILPRYPNPIA